MTSAWLNNPDTERRTAARTARRGSLLSQGGPREILILDEPVLRSQVGGSEVHAEQQAVLAAAAERPNLQSAARCREEY